MDFLPFGVLLVDQDSRVVILNRSAERILDQILIRLHGLTPAEARLAGLLMQGKSPNDATDELHVGKETVRSQLKNLLSKTGTHRQGELIRMLLNSPAGLRLV